MAVIGRFKQGESQVRWGLVQGEDVQFVDDPFASLEPNGQSARLSELEVLVPVQPPKLFAIGLNYHAHVAEFGGREVPEVPLMWFKAPTSLLAHEGTIEIAHTEHRTDFEAELAIVIGRGGRGIREEDALSHVLGYAPSQDISDRVVQRSESQWARGKSMDTYTPLGPFITTDLSAQDVRVQSLVNGEVKQDARTSAMIFPLAKIISFVSQDITLQPGDVILTGTPEGVGPLSPGDVLETRIEGMAPLVNRVAARGS